MDRLLNTLRVLVIAIAITTQAWADSVKQKTLHIVTENFPPFMIAKPVNGLHGFDYEVVKIVFERLGYDTNITFLPWKRALRDAEYGAVLGVFSCAYTSDRDKFLHIRSYLSTATNGFYKIADRKLPDPTSFEKVQGHTIASVAGYESFDALKRKGFSPLEAKDTRSAIMMLAARRFDYLYMTKEGADFEIKRQGLKDVFSFQPIVEKDFFFCFSKKYPNVEKIMIEFETELRKVRADGTYEAIHARYR